MPVMPVIVVMMMVVVSPRGWRRRRRRSLKIDANRRSPRFVRTTERKSLLRGKHNHVKSQDVNISSKSLGKKLNLPVSESNLYSLDG